MRKIAIVGTAPTSVNDAPYGDTTWEIWSLGSNQSVIKRFTRWFELHTFHALSMAGALQPQRVEFFKRIGKSLTIGHPNPELPDAVMYPKDEIVAMFGNYFTSSISWMIALAIYEGADEIGLWGIDMIGEGEYAHQRACCERLLGYAQGKGIKITISPHSPLMRAERMYAFEYTNLAGEIQKRISELREMHKQAHETELKAMRDKAFHEGQLTNLHEMERRWG